MQSVGVEHDTLSSRGYAPPVVFGLATIAQLEPSHCSMSGRTMSVLTEVNWVIAPVMTQLVALVHDTPPNVRSTAISEPDEPIAVHLAPSHRSIRMWLKARPELFA